MAEKHQILIEVDPETGVIDLHTSYLYQKDVVDKLLRLANDIVSNMSANEIAKGPKMVS